jgi:hypothetical protein
MRSVLIGLSVVVLVVGCSTQNSGSSSGADASSSGSDGSTGSSDDASITGMPGTDGSTTGVDAGSGPVDAAFDAKGSNAVCSFNKDCPSAERCECDEVTGCFCHIGVRGTGKNGIDQCVTGNDCQSALCIEGPTKNVFYCSDECKTAAQCTGMLPKCTNIALVGMVCVRM